jgi:hypothetical protein
MMELVVLLARATSTPIGWFLKLPIRRLGAWADITAKILEKENDGKK